MKMRQYVLLLAASFTLGFSGGCATIVSERKYEVTIDNPPAPTCFSVYDRKNEVVEQGITPQQVTLDAKAFPFWPAKYSVVMAGTESTSQKLEVQAGFDPWIAGNLVLGGGLGAVVDGATGAMFRLPKRVTGSVSPQYAVTDRSMGYVLASKEVGEDQPAPISLSSNTPVMPASHVQSKTK